MPRDNETENHAESHPDSHRESRMSITPQEALTRVVEHREIFHDEMLALMRQIMGGEMSPEIGRAHV